MLLDLRSLWESTADRSGGATAIVNVVATGSGIGSLPVVQVAARPALARRRLTIRGRWVAPAAELGGSMRVLVRRRCRGELVGAPASLEATAHTSLVRIEDEELMLLLAAMR